MPQPALALSIRCALRHVVASAPVLLACGATVYGQPAPRVALVADTGCPLSLETASLTASPSGGVMLTYTILNSETDTVKDVVITAAAINVLGEVVSLRMQPVRKKIAPHSSQQFAVVFPDLDLKHADAVAVGIQGVRWSGRREEWRAALRVTGAPVLTEK